MLQPVANPQRELLGPYDLQLLYTTIHRDAVRQQDVVSAKKDGRALPRLAEGRAGRCYGDLPRQEARVHVLGPQQVGVGRRRLSGRELHGL